MLNLARRRRTEIRGWRLIANPQSLISLFLLALIIFAPLALVYAQAATPTVYVVQPGDTLFSIARRFNISLSELAQFNGLLNPNLIYVGQTIKIPSSGQAASPSNTPTPAAPEANYRVHIVQPSENLFRISLRYGVSVQAIAAANHLGSTTLIFVGQQLSIPISGDATADAPIARSTVPLPEPFLTFDVGPLPVTQGDLVSVKIRTREPVTLRGLFIDWSIPFAKAGDTYYGLVGVSASPVDGPLPGLYPLNVTATDARGAQVTVSASVQVASGRYNSEYIDLPPDRQGLLDPELLAAERNKLNAVWTIFNPTRYWSGPFGLPIADYRKISSPFGTRRSYNGGPFSSYHEGTDFSAVGGTPVNAPANGVIVLAEPLTVRGNAILIDHGWGVYTGLYHLSSIDVVVGQEVKQGDFIGRVGGTGLSTGPHLHWDIRIRSLNVDPLQLTRQALP
ncbi:MAG TPA: LysM peptidoglycan-binding domain-containing protein [Anaerolineae bacterium]|nr:LysM peptidoglycan-binding domain-containing protein [Anaerolineae bacterium]